MNVLKNIGGNISRRKFISMSLAAGIISMAGTGRYGFAQSSGNDMTLILLGTQGGPNFNLNRGETASLVMVDGQPYLVDCGYGTLRALLEAGVSFLDISHVFLTHLHDDHSADLVTLMGHQWTQGRIDPTQVYGPYGTNVLVRAGLQYNSTNTRIRMLDEGRSVRPGGLFTGHDVPATQVPYKMYEDDNITVHSIENTHYPEDFRTKLPYRSLSYRFESRKRSIVFSGDTGYSSNLVTLASAADVLVCETMDVTGTRRAFDAMVADGLYADNAESIWKHIAGTHASTEDAGRIAAEAGVKLLVLNHLIPGSLQDLADDIYLRGVRKYFKGKVIIGRDQLRI